MTLGLAIDLTLIVSVMKTADVTKVLFKDDLTCVDSTLGDCSAKEDGVTGVTLRDIDVLCVRSLLISVTFELFAPVITELLAKLVAAKLVTSVAIGIKDVSTGLAGVNCEAVLLSCVTKGVTVDMLLTVTTLLLMREEENLTVVNLDPTVGAMDEVIFTKVLSRVIIRVVLRDRRVVKPLVSLTLVTVLLTGVPVELSCTVLGILVVSLLLK